MVFLILKYDFFLNKKVKYFDFFYLIFKKKNSTINHKKKKVIKTNGIMLPWSFLIMS